MMRLLGKIGIFFILFASLYGVELKVANSQITSGESVRFEISANGDDVEFPDIDEIDGFGVRQTGSSYKTSNINGKVTTVKIKSYIFHPTKSVTIPAFVVNVDGKEEYTQPLHVSMVSQKKINGKVPYSVSLHVSDDSPFVGQMIKFSIVLKIDERLNVGDLQMGFDGLENFWAKDKPTQTQSNEDGYKIIKATYWVSPLKDGNQTIGPVSVRIGIASKNSFDPFFQRLNYKMVRSHVKSLHVKPLPNGAKVVGDFSIQATADTKDVEAGKPVNVVINVKGDGNLDELESLKQQIKDVVIYEDKPKIDSGFKNGVYESSWSQKLAYIGSRDFTIPPFSLTYFDTKTSQTKTIKTNPIPVHVNGKIATANKSEIVTPTKEPKPKVIVKKEGVNWIWILLSFVVGTAFGILLTTFKKPNLKKPKIFKNQKELLQELLPHKGKDSELDTWITKLEANIYEGKKESIDSKKIEAILKNKFS